MTDNRIEEARRDLTCVHPDCADRLITRGQDYFAFVAEPESNPHALSGPMHLECSHKSFQLP